MVERILGALKARFRILLKPMYYDLETQGKLIRALCCLHNFITRAGGTLDGLEENEADDRGKYSLNHFEVYRCIELTNI